MRRNLLLTGILMLIVMCVNAQNLVTNGDFETGDLTGWTVASGEIETVAPLAGTASYLRGWGKGDLIEQSLSTTAGKEYTLSYEAKVAWNWIYVYARVYDAADTSEIAATSIFKNDQSPASLNFIAPAGGSVILKFSKDADSPGKIWIDNISLIEADATTTQDVNQTTIIVFPNPSEGVFTISNSELIVSYKVFNTVGQLVKESSMLSLNEVNIDLSLEDKGIYLLQLTDITGNTQVSKVLIK